MIQTTDFDGEPLEHGVGIHCYISGKALRAGVRKPIGCYIPRAIRFCIEAGMTTAIYQPDETWLFQDPGEPVFPAHLDWLKEYKA